MTDEQAKHEDLRCTLRMQPKIPTFEFTGLTLRPLAVINMDLAIAAADRTVYNDNKTIWEEEGQWFFVDETWTDKVGPYGSEEEARDALNAYCRDVLGL